MEALRAMPSAAQEEEEEEDDEEILARIRVLLQLAKNTDEKTASLPRFGDPRMEGAMMDTYSCNQRLMRSWQT